MHILHLAFFGLIFMDVKGRQVSCEEGKRREGEERETEGGGKENKYHISIINVLLFT